jgi:hypothetical protein
MRIIDGENMELVATIDAFKAPRARSILGDLLDCDGDVIFFEEDRGRVDTFLKGLRDLFKY